MQTPTLLIVVLLSQTSFCHAMALRSGSQKRAKNEIVVLKERSLVDSWNAPMLELARAIRVRPRSRIFHVSGYSMFGGYQDWDFWYDRGRHRLRYKYVSGGETYSGREEGVWSGVTDDVLEELARDHLADKESGTEMLGFETLGKYGCKLERVWKVGR